MVWRLLGDTESVRNVLTGPGSQWVEAAEDATTHHIRLVEGDWVLVATETPNAVAVADSIAEWQSRDQALERSGLVRAPDPRGLVLLQRAP